MRGLAQREQGTVDVNHYRRSRLRTCLRKRACNEERHSDCKIASHHHTRVFYRFR